MKPTLTAKLYFLFWLFACSVSAQQTIDLDTNFKGKSVRDLLFYYEDHTQEVTATSIVHQKFAPIPTSFPGKQDAKIWLRLKLDNIGSTQLQLISRIHTISLNQLVWYKETNGQLEKIFTHTALHNKNIEIPFVLTTQEKATFYIEVFFRKSVYFPIKIVKASTNKTINQRLEILLGLFYSFSFIVLLINLLFYLNTRNIFFLWYCVLLLSTTLILFELDNGFYLLFGNSPYIQHIDLCLHIGLAIGVLLFTSEAIRIKRYYPRLSRITVGLILLNILCYLIYAYTDQLVWYATGTSINIIILLTYGIVAILLFKKEVYASFVVIGYSLFLLFSLLYDLPVQYGMVDTGITEWLLKIGALMEMIVFLYAISYRHKKATSSKEEILQRLQQELIAQQMVASENMAIKRQLKTTKTTQQLHTQQLFTDFAQQYEFTARETDIGMLLLKGYSNKEIATHLALKTNTVKYHIANMFIKLDITKRADFLHSFSVFKQQHQKHN